MGGVVRVRALGGFIRHALGVLLLTWRHALRVCLLMGGIAALSGELIATLVARRFPAPPLAQVVIALVSVAVAYGALLTAFLDELIVGMLDMTRRLQGDARAGARAAAIIAERDTHDVGAALARLVGLSSLASSFSALAALARHQVPRASHAASPAPRGSVWNQTPDAPAYTAPRSEADETSDETLHEIAETESFQSTAPRPRVDARPVAAGKLPRIGWTYEHPAITAETLAAHAETHAEEQAADDDTRDAVAPLALWDGLRVGPAEAGDEVVAPGAPQRALDRSLDRSPSRAQPGAPMPPLPPRAVPLSRSHVSTLAERESDAAWTRSDQGVSRDAPASIEPSPAQPLEAERGVWARISRALVGHVEPAPSPQSDGFDEPYAL